MKKEKNSASISSIIIVIILLASVSIYTVRLSKIKREKNLSQTARLDRDNLVTLNSDIELPVRWDDLGAQMIKAGVIDEKTFKNLYSGRGGLSAADQKLLTGSDNGNIVINADNSGLMLNMLWALGLGNKNPILESGPMMDSRYGGAENFASTGGWSLAKGNVMSHYSMHKFIILTPEQQALVEKVAKNIYRPCCDNSTYFPDCNHGMAMLGLLELMASRGMSEADMYKFTLEVNTLWFPSQYAAIKTLFVSKNIDWNTIDPKRILGTEFSSASGYQKVLSQIQPQEQKGGTSCGA